MTAAAFSFGEPTGEFSKRWGDNFSRLFKHRNKNAAAIKDSLVEMISFILPGFRRIPEEVREDIAHDTLIFAIGLIPAADPTQNIGAWYRTCLNREIADKAKKYQSKSEELPELTNADRSLPPIDPMAIARAAREPASYKLTDFVSLVTACECIDVELDNYARTIKETDDFQLVLNLDAAAFALQKVRRLLCGEFRPMVLGTRRFTATSIFSVRTEQ